MWDMSLWGAKLLPCLHLTLLHPGVVVIFVLRPLHKTCNAFQATALECFRWLAVPSITLISSLVRLSPRMFRMLDEVGTWPETKFITCTRSLPGVENTSPDIYCFQFTFYLDLWPAVGMYDLLMFINENRLSVDFNRFFTYVCNSFANKQSRICFTRWKDTSYQGRRRSNNWEVSRFIHKFPMSDVNQNSWHLFPIFTSLLSYLNRIPNVESELLGRQQLIFHQISSSTQR